MIDEFTRLGDGCDHYKIVNSGLGSDDLIELRAGLKAAGYSIKDIAQPLNC